MQAELAQLPTDLLETMAARYAWIMKARPDQLRPADKMFWMMLGGRGSGKTRAGAEDMWWSASRNPGQRIAVIGPTFGDVRKTCFEGESGLLAVTPPKLVKNYNRGNLEMWLTNDAYFVGYSSEEPERLRGPQHHRAWCDELGAWRYAVETWDMMMFGLRLGPQPDVIVTTTPRPVPLVRMLNADADTGISRASTFANAKNLPKAILQKWRDKYDGTRLGRQELFAEILEDLAGALWNRTIFDKYRVREAPIMSRIVVAVDPSGSKGLPGKKKRDAEAISLGDGGNDIGIIVVGKGKYDGRGYVLADLTLNDSPEKWGRAAVDAYHEYGASCIVGEINYGGAMVHHVIKTADSTVPFREVTASRGKVQRAEPVAMLYEQGKVSHVSPVTLQGNRFSLSELEDQMCLMSPEGYVGDGSPDRADALVWGLTELMISTQTPIIITDGVLARAAQRSMRLHR